MYNVSEVQVFCNTFFPSKCHNYCVKASDLRYPRCLFEDHCLLWLGVILYVLITAGCVVL